MQLIEPNTRMTDNVERIFMYLFSNEILRDEYFNVFHSDLKDFRRYTLIQILLGNILYNDILTLILLLKFMLDSSIGFVLTYVLVKLEWKTRLKEEDSWFFCTRENWSIIFLYFFFCAFQILNIKSQQQKQVFECIIGFRKKIIFRLISLLIGRMPFAK